MTYKNFLKMYRKQSDIMQQDVAYLLNIKPSNLNRYESGQRQATPEIILAYHILFGTCVKDLLHQQHTAVSKKIITRGKSLLAKLEKQTIPKSSKRILFIEHIVNLLEHDSYE